MIKKFIERPVLSTVISIIIVIIGILGIVALPVSRYPDIAPVTVTVSANYTGANAETVLNSVIIPLEEQINGVENMDYITSTANNSGSGSISVFFKQGTDPNIAVVNVQNRVARANSILPAEVVRSGVITQKRNSGSLMFLTFFSENPDLDDTFVQNYMNINIIPAIKRINGVGDADVFGGKDYSMRIWLNPDKLAAYHLEPAEVTSAITTQSREAAAGTLGQNSGGSYQYVIKYKGKLNEVSEYENIVIKALDGGRVLRLKDVAEIELGSFSYTGFAKNNGNPAVSMGVYQTPGSNAQEIINEVKAYLESARATFPEGIDYRVNLDTNEFLDAAISKVVRTLLEAFLLVFLVVYIFLQDFRSTLIPAIAVPVSIIGTFFFLNLFGYTINMLTLFALILAIGIVVDDAIIVVEAVHAKMEGKEQTAKSATIKAMHEISGAIISVTLVMAAVFVPVTFIGGTTGVFYKQFGITLIISIMISAVNALTLSPVLCSLFLKAHPDKAYENKSFMQKFFYKFNIAFKAASKRYGNTFTFFLRHKWVTLVLFALAGVVFYTVNNQIKTGFIPTEDDGTIFINAELIPGASMERTAAVMEQVQQKLQNIPGVSSVTYITGRSFMSGAGSNYGMGFLRLKPFKERAAFPDQGIETVKGLAFEAVADIPEAKIFFFQPSAVPGFGMNAGFSIVLLDRSGGEIKDLERVSTEFIDKLSKRPEIQYVQSSFDANFPQYQMTINVERAAQSGVSVSSILSVLQGYIGGIYVNDFIKYGKQFRVMVQSLPENRKDINNLNGLMVKTSSGEMAPISQFITLERTFGPQVLNRYNLFTSINLTGANAEGYSTGDALKAVQEVASETLDANYSIDYTGMTREEQTAGSQTVIIYNI